MPARAQENLGSGLQVGEAARAQEILEGGGAQSAGGCSAECGGQL